MRNDNKNTENCIIDSQHWGFEKALLIFFNFLCSFFSAGVWEFIGVEARHTACWLHDLGYECICEYVLQCPISLSRTWSILIRAWLYRTVGAVHTYVLSYFLVVKLFGAEGIQTANGRGHLLMLLQQIRTISNTYVRWELGVDFRNAYNTSWKHVQCR